MSKLCDYAGSRVLTLKPSIDAPPNPFKVLGTLKRKQWLFFLVAFCGWMWDAFDFFTVSLTVEDLAAQFDKTNAEITWGITVTLMLRFVGSTIFGIAADRYGRKWPFIVNNLLFAILELGTGFTQTFSQFLAVRSLFGIAMGGLYGNAMATALEDAPVKARGILSGLMQQGYACGYLLVTVFARGLVNTTSHGWRPLYWFGACPPILIIIFRLMLPETDAYKEREKIRLESQGISKTFFAEGKVALKRHYFLIVYMIFLMAGFNFMSHGSQDLYPTMLTNQYKFSPDSVTVTQVVANLGASVGGTLGGYCSQVVGRRLCIIIACVFGGALLYPYTFVSNSGIIAAAFFEQFFVQAAFGVIPIHLSELSPPGFRAFVVGTTYQLGSLTASASSTIEATLGERFPLPPGKRGVVKRYRYGTVICVFMGCVYLYIIMLTVIGPEKRGRSMQVEEDDDLVAAVDLAPEKIHDVVHGEDVEASENVKMEKGAGERRREVTEV